MISSHSSVGVIIYHTELDALIVVRQFRPPVSLLLPELPSVSLHGTLGIGFCMRSHAGSQIYAI